LRLRLKNEMYLQIKINLPYHQILCRCLIYILINDSHVMVLKAVSLTLILILWLERAALNLEIQFST
jgi:hypothetical protein